MKAARQGNSHESQPQTHRHASCKNTKSVSPATRGREVDVVLDEVLVVLVNFAANSRAALFGILFSFFFSS